MKLKHLHKPSRARIPFHVCLPQPTIAPNQAYPQCLICGRAIKTVIKLERTDASGRKSKQLIALNRVIMERIQEKP